MNEEWRDIKGYEGRYQISNRGRIRSYRDKRKILAQQTHYKGHLFVQIRTAGIKRKHFIHRLVAIAFIQKIEGKDIVNHKDGNKKNNQHENLEWVTMTENTRHYFRELRNKTARLPLDNQHAVN